MKIKNIYKIAGILLLYIVLQSRAAGPGSAQNLQVTGAPGSTGIAGGQPGTCANIGCHTEGAFSPTLSMSLFEGTNLVAKYEPGKAYTLKITNSPIQGIPDRYGFQAVALTATNTQAGDWGPPGQGNHVTTISNRKYIEHSAPKTTGIFELPWIAPAAGTGTVKFYAASIASNNNNNVEGDGTTKNSLEITESGVNSTNTANRDFASMKLTPNPVDANMYLQINSVKAGNHQLRIVDMAGAVLKTSDVSLQAGENQVSLPVAELASGLYLVQLCGDGHMAAVQMLKK